MKRKIMKIADTTYVVSLPLKWARENNVKKGDEIELEINGIDINLSIRAKEIKKSIFSKDLKNNLRTGQSYITSLYRKGVEEIDFKYNDPDYIKQIQKCISEQTIGLEIVKNSVNSCKIIDFSGKKDDEFDNTLRRSWLLLLGMAEEISELIEKKDFLSLERIYFQDKNINKFTNYCLRNLQEKNRIFRSYKSTVLYHFIRCLEELGDEYHNFSEYIKNKKQFDNTKNLTELNNVLREFYELFYKYSDDGLEELFNKTKKIRHDLEKDHKNHDSISLHYLMGINSRIRKLLSTLLEIQLGNIEE